MRAGRKATGLIESAGLPPCTHALSPHSSSFSPPPSWCPRRSPTRSRATEPRSPRRRVPTQTSSPRAGNLPRIRRAILCLHNQVRDAAGLPGLRENPKLRKAALGHSRKMVQTGFFEHTTPTGVTMVDRILRAAYVREDQGWSLGENLAWGSGSLGTPRAAFRSWLDSPGHRANILRRSYRELGVGVVLGVPVSDAVGRDLHGRLRGRAASLRANGRRPTLPRPPLRPRARRRPRRRRRAALRRDRRRAARRPRRAVAAQRRRDRPPAGRRRPVRPCGGRLRALARGRRAGAGRAARAVGARAGLHGPRRRPPHAPRLLRPRARGGVRPGPHPPARAHAPGPEGGPAAADAGDGGQPLPHLQPLRRPARGPPGARSTRSSASRSTRSPTRTARPTACGASPTATR